MKNIHVKHLWASGRLKLPVIRVFVQQFVPAKLYDKSKLGITVP